MNGSDNPPGNEWDIDAMLNKEGLKRTEALRHHMQDIAHQVHQDQTEWLDGVMKKLMPYKLWKDARNLTNLDEVKKWFRDKDVKLINIPDTQRLRVTVKDYIVAEFTPQFTIDGELIKREPHSGT